MVSGSEEGMKAPSLRNGLRYFNSRNQVQHRGAMLAGIGLWLVVYAVSAQIDARSAQATVELAAITASGITGLYFGVLYTRALGSPLVDIGAASTIPLVIPPSLYTILVPASSRTDKIILLATDPRLHGAIPAGMVAGLAATLTVWVLWYMVFINDPSEWEAEHMPEDLRLFLIGDEVSEMLVSLRLEWLGPVELLRQLFKFITVGAPILLGIILPVVIVLMTVPALSTITFRDIVGPVLVVWMYVYFKLTERYPRLRSSLTKSSK